jgi:hypothetical protein
LDKPRRNGGVKIAPCRIIVAKSPQLFVLTLDAAVLTINPVAEPTDQGWISAHLWLKKNSKLSARVE